MSCNYLESYASECSKVSTAPNLLQRKVSSQRSTTSSKIQIIKHLKCKRLQKSAFSSEKEKTRPKRKHGWPSAPGFPPAKGQLRFLPTPPSSNLSPFLLMASNPWMVINLTLHLFETWRFFSLLLLWNMITIKLLENAGFSPIFLLTRFIYMCFNRTWKIPHTIKC